MSSTTSFKSLDPNRFASGFEAQAVRARSEIEQAEVELARRRQALARETYNAAEQRFIEVEAAYRQCRAEKEDATLYLERAGSHLETSIERLAETNALLHPVRKTPPEILGIIFESCLEYLPETAPISERQSDIRKRQVQPFYLAAVCRRWRRASLAFSRAWAAFDLLLDDVSKSNVTHWKDFVSSYLDRSATRPLDIRVIRKSPDAGYAIRLIPRIVGEMGRCQSLLVSAPELEEFGDVLEPLVTARTPALRYLHFLIARENMLLDTSQLFPHAPNLVKVRTSVPGLLDDSDSFPNMTGVVLCSPSITDVEDDLAVLVDEYPKLSLLSLVNARFDDIEAQEKLKIPVQVLRVAQHSNAGHLNALARIYAFPTLSTATLSGPPRCSEARVGLLTELARVAPLLRNLNIENVASTNFAQLAATLHQLPRLKLLNIKFTDIDSSGLTELCSALAQPTVRADRTSWPCPLLEYIKLRTCTLAPGCPQERFVELTERRLRASADAEGPRRPLPLRIVELPLGMDAEIKARVAELLASK